MEMKSRQAEKKRRRRWRAAPDVHHPANKPKPLGTRGRHSIQCLQHLPSVRAYSLAYLAWNEKPLNLSRGHSDRVVTTSLTRSIIIASHQLCPFFSACVKIGMICAEESDGKEKICQFIFSLGDRMTYYKICRRRGLIFEKRKNKFLMGEKRFVKFDARPQRALIIAYAYWIW